VVGEGEKGRYNFVEPGRSEGAVGKYRDTDNWERKGLGIK
jgi:hypothetical protein